MPFAIVLVLFFCFFNFQNNVLTYRSIIRSVTFTKQTNEKIYCIAFVIVATKPNLTGRKITLLLKWIANEQRKRKEKQQHNKVSDTNKKNCLTISQIVRFDSRLLCLFRDAIANIETIINDKNIANNNNNKIVEEKWFKKKKR